MPRVRAALVGALTLAAASAATPAAVADPGGSGGVTVSPGAASPGERVTLSTVNPELDDGVAVRSEAFAKPVALKPTGKVSFAGKAQVRCDAKPGTYTLRFTKPVHPGEDTLAGEVTVEAGAPVEGACAGEADRDGKDDGDGGWSSTAVAVTAALAGFAVVAAGAFLVIRRKRRL
ncbi:hypothetical protein RB200_34080 [Streptomyces sp. PmtG]